MAASSIQRKKSTGRAARTPGPLSGAAAAARRQKALDLGVLNGHLGYFVRRLQVDIFKDFIRTLSVVDVRPAQYSVLVLIGANPGRSQAEIGVALNIERARLVRLLDALERRGWTQRLAAVGDRRSHALFLTSDGKKAIERIKKLATRHETRLAERLGTRRWAQLLTLLRDNC